MATVILNAPPSDESSQRQFLLNELCEMTRYEWQDKKVAALVKLYNLNAPKYPKTTQELIDAFKNGKVAIDEKKVALNAAYLNDDADEVSDRYDDDDNYVGERYYGITFTDLPVADRKGYEKALGEYRKLVVDTKRKLAILSPAAGLDALIAFEAWMPVKA